MIQRCFKLSAVVIASRDWWLWCPQTNVLIRRWSHRDCFSWAQLAFLGWVSFSGLPSNNVSSDIILIQFSFCCLHLRIQLIQPYTQEIRPKLLRFFTWITATALGLFALPVPSAWNTLFAPVLMTCFLTSSGLCSSLTFVDLVKEAFSHHPI